MRTLKKKIAEPIKHLLIVLIYMLTTCPAISLAQQKEINVRGGIVTASDIAALPPVCKLITIDKPGIHNGAGDKPLVDHIPILNDPQYVLARNNPHLHHYCWALISKQRYFRAKGDVERNHHIKEFEGDIEYVIKNTNKKWPFFDVMLLELASMHLIRGKYAVCIQKADEALGFRPNAEKAFTLKSDAYKLMGKNDLAIKAAQDGLILNPKSMPIIKRLKKLGAPPPVLLDSQDKNNGANVLPEKDAAKSTLTTLPYKKDAIPGIAQSDANSESHNKDIPNPNPLSEHKKNYNELGKAKPNEPPSGGNHTNPYCRFCP
jgi:hypothetical protein